MLSTGFATRTDAVTKMEGFDTEVTVISALPIDTPVTIPSATVATLSSEEAQVTVLSALKGAMSTRSLKVSPILRDTESRFRTILRTAGEAAKADRGTRARSKTMAVIITANDLLIAMIPSASNYRCLSKGGAGTVFNRWDKYTGFCGFCQNKPPCAGSGKGSAGTSKSSISV